jgi:hypothetical protein
VKVCLGTRFAIPTFHNLNSKNPWEFRNNDDVGPTAGLSPLLVLPCANRHPEFPVVIGGGARVLATLRKGIPHAWGNRTNAELRMAVFARPGALKKYCAS